MAADARYAAVVRPYQADDRPGLITLLTDCRLLTTAEGVRTSGRLAFDTSIAVIGGVVVGFVQSQLTGTMTDLPGVGGHPGDQLWIFNLYVSPRFRSHRLGEALLAHQVSKAAHAGATFAALQVDHQGDFERRVAFFAACGLDWLSRDDRLMGSPIQTVLAAIQAR